jgi:hypothetical protein
MILFPFILNNRSFMSSSFVDIVVPINLHVFLLCKKIVTKHLGTFVRFTVIFMLPSSHC